MPTAYIRRRGGAATWPREGPSGRRGRQGAWAWALSLRASGGAPGGPAPPARPPRLPDPQARTSRWPCPGRCCVRHCPSRPVSVPFHLLGRPTASASHPPGACAAPASPRTLAGTHVPQRLPARAAHSGATLEPRGAAPAQLTVLAVLPAEAQRAAAHVCVPPAHTAAPVLAPGPLAEVPLSRAAWRQSGRDGVPAVPSTGPRSAAEGGGRRGPPSPGTGPRLPMADSAAGHAAGGGVVRDMECPRGR